MYDSETKQSQNVASACQDGLSLIVEAFIPDSTLDGKHFADWINVHFNIWSNIKALEARFVLV